MSTIAALNAYASTRSLYGQSQSSDGASQSSARRLQNLSSKASEATKRQTLLSPLDQLSGSLAEASLSDQLSGLVRLIRYAMDSMGLEKNSRVTFSQLKKYCSEVEERFSSAVQDGLESLAVDPDTVTYTLDERGSLTAHSASPVNEALAQLGVNESGKSVQKLVQDLRGVGVSLTPAFTFSLAADGTVTALGDSAAWQEILDGAEVRSQALATNILTQGVDPKVDFSLQSKNEVVTVNCSQSKYTDVLQAFFDENPSIVADFQRTEALSGIEDARKFMRLAPSDIRTRLQLESIAAWWDTSGQSSTTSSFGLYNSGVFSRLYGVNLSV